MSDENNSTHTTFGNTPRDNIRKKVLQLEKKNYLLKPEGLSDGDMVNRIKQIIETEVGK